MDDGKPIYLAIAKDEGFGRDSYVLREISLVARYLNAGLDCYAVEKMHKIESIDCFATYSELLVLPNYREP